MAEPTTVSLGLGVTEVPTRLPHGPKTPLMVTHLSGSKAAALGAWRTQPVVVGAIAGLAGGIVFGLMMQLLMPPMTGLQKLAET